MNETKVVWEGITVGGKTMREHLEIINHRDAISYVEDIVHNEELFSEWQLKNLHHLVLKGMDECSLSQFCASKRKYLRSPNL